MQYAPETTALSPGFLKTHQIATHKKKILFTMSKLQIYFSERINKAAMKHSLLGG